jgi:group I intron endonuclease
MMRRAEDRVVVYALTFPAACLIYVGSTKNYGVRRSNHLSTLRKRRHSNRKVQEAFDLHGTVEFSVLERVTEPELKAKEQEWLDALYEAVPGGRVLNLAPSSVDGRGVKYTDESRARMSAAQKGRKKTDEQREKNRQAALRRWADPAIRKQYVESATESSAERERDEAGRFL